LAGIQILLEGNPYPAISPGRPNSKERPGVKKKYFTIQGTISAEKEREVTAAGAKKTRAVVSAA